MPGLDAHSGPFSRRSLIRYLAIGTGAAVLSPLAVSCAKPGPAPAPTPGGIAAGQGRRGRQALTEAPKAADAPKPSGSGAEYVAAAQLASRPGKSRRANVHLDHRRQPATWTAALKRSRRRTKRSTAKIEHTPGPDYWDKLTVAYAGGTPPDVIYTAPNRRAARGRLQGMLLDLTPFVIRDERSTLDDHQPVGSQQPYKWDGKMWAPGGRRRHPLHHLQQDPVQGSGPRRPAEGLGRPVFTMDAFLTYCQKLTNPSQQTWGYVFEGNGSAARLTWLFGADYWDNQDSRPRPSWTARRESRASSSCRTWSTGTRSLLRPPKHRRLGPDVPDGQGRDDLGRLQERRRGAPGHQGLRVGHLDRAERHTPDVDRQPARRSVIISKHQGARPGVGASSSTSASTKAT